jgi:hypothetical protein
MAQPGALEEPDQEQDDEGGDQKPGDPSGATHEGC